MCRCCLRMITGHMWRAFCQNNDTPTCKTNASSGHVGNSSGMTRFDSLILYLQTTSTLFNSKVPSWSCTSKRHPNSSTTFKIHTFITDNFTDISDKLYNFEKSLYDKECNRTWNRQCWKITKIILHNYGEKHNCTKCHFNDVHLSLFLYYFRSLLGLGHFFRISVL